MKMHVCVIIIIILTIIIIESSKHMWYTSHIAASRPQWIRVEFGGLFEWLCLVPSYTCCVLANEGPFLS